MTRVADIIQISIGSDFADKLFMQSASAQLLLLSSKSASALIIREAETYKEHNFSFSVIEKLLV